MSTHVVGFRPPDERWKTMAAVWKACELAGVDIPEEVHAFFNHEDPSDKAGMEIPLGDAIREWSGEMQQGFEVAVSKLPKDVQVLRFYNSW